MFGKKPEPENSPMVNTRSGSAQSFSVLGTDLSLKGDITASSDLHIDGRIDGDITCDSLVQGETSTISGAVTAKSARLSGRVDGSVSCANLVILKSARITGDVHYDSLTIEQGAVVDGRLSPHGAAQAGRGSGEQVLMLKDAAE
jgi:cytoskeletal protein CcmA (bactofilin family)